MNMRFEFNLGKMPVAVGGKGAPGATQKFRIALLGDWSARAHRGLNAPVEELAARKALRVDIDNFDAVMQRCDVRLRLPFGVDGGPIELPITMLEDFHPDQLYANLPIFSRLAELRDRLQDDATFAAAAQEVQSWARIAAVPRETRVPEATSSGQGDFDRLLGRPVTEEPAPGIIGEAIRRIVEPHIQPGSDPRQEALVAAVDEALSSTMRAVLHHPDFQAAEALWRSVDFLIRRLETDEQLQVVLVDLSAEELAADLAATDDLTATAVYRMLVEAPPQSATEGAYAAVLGCYVFQQTPETAERLGRLARIVAQIPAPFVSAMDASILDRNEDDAKEAWDALAARPEAGCLGLTVPRFLLRLPYGDRTDPIDAFDFKECTGKTGVQGLLWGNSAVLAGLLLGQSYTEQGRQIDPGTLLEIGDLPLYYYTDSEGDQVAVPCTERLLTSREAEELIDRGFMPVLAIKGLPEVRLADFRAVNRGMLRGHWNLPETAPDDVRQDDRMTG
jgi:hypothetical protein